MIEHLRIQDIVARTAGISLRDSVKSLRSLRTVAGLMGQVRLVEELDIVLSDSAEVNGHIAKLHDLPGKLNVEACNVANELVHENVARREREMAFRLLDCPYGGAKLRGLIEKAS